MLGSCHVSSLGIEKLFMYTLIDLSQGHMTHKLCFCYACPSPFFLRLFKRGLPDLVNTNETTLVSSLVMID